MKDKKLLIYNKSKKDIYISDIGTMIRRGCVTNAYKYNTNLHQVEVKYSSRFGELKKLLGLKAILILEKMPEKIKRVPYAVDKTPIPTRSRSCIAVDQSDDFVEQLQEEFMTDTTNMSESDIAKLNEKFVDEVDLDGFLDDNYITD